MEIIRYLPRNKLYEFINDHYRNSILTVLNTSLMLLKIVIFVNFEHYLDYKTLAAIADSRCVSNKMSNKF